LLSGIKITKYDDLKKASKILGAKNVVITGHSFVKNKISDFVYENGKNYSITGKKITGVNHGSGCNFAIALAYSIAQKHKLKDSVEFAKQFAYDSIKSAQSLGRGVKVTSPTTDKIKSELGVAIKEFEGLTDVYSLIPECQTNFVFAQQNPKSINDIAGVLGRIVRAGNRVVVAGNLEFGGSRHVATAVLAVQKKFPEIRSALNLRFDETLIRKFAKKKYKILSYDRTKEPNDAKFKENYSISWGMQNATKSSVIPPDIIYHKGDFGKEPMIIVFGKNPKEVVAKVSKMLGS
jgi:hydroxymethylpyrimidine/phosphomethylpyrimidine kinase